MKIDEKALDAACQEFKEWLYIQGKTSEDERAAIKATIKAYEAARWRPIEEAEDQIGSAERVLICLTDTQNEIYDAFPMDDAPTWYFDTDDPFEIRHTDLVKRGALFRTIDMPSKP